MELKPRSIVSSTRERVWAAQAPAGPIKVPGSGLKERVVTE